MQSDENSFGGDVFQSFDITSRYEDNILDQIYKFSDFYQGDLLFS